MTPAEQFGFCEGDSAIDCGNGSACGAFGPCQTKAFYHDFGFLNGPLLVPGSDGTPLLVSGSKDGSLYAFDPETGDITWRSEILPVPVSPSFAGWGLFNGAIGFADGRIHGALYGHGSPMTMPANHLQAFDVATGQVVWADDIGNSWGDVAIGGGVVYTGTQASREFYAYDAATGERLRTFTMPENVAGGAAIVNGWLYIPYGVFGEGGVQAWALN